MQNQCSYLVRVQTGDVSSAGTDSTISLELLSSSGDGIIVKNLETWGIMEPGHDYFEQGNLDIFDGTDTCVDVCSMTVTSNGEGHKPGWYLDSIEIIISGSISKKVAFPVNQWLALDEWPYHLYATVNLCSQWTSI